MSVLSNWKGHEQLAASGPLFDNTRIEVYFSILKNVNRVNYLIVGLMNFDETHMHKG